MIRNEQEYKEAIGRIAAEEERLEEHRRSLETEGLDAEQVQRLVDPMLSFHAQLVEDVRSYERLRRGEFDALQNLHGIGRLLVGLRIFRGLTQKELADQLGVDPSQVSRDERDEYHNIRLAIVAIAASDNGRYVSLGVFKQIRIF